MTKNLLFAMALMSLALAGGCAKGGNGIIPTVAVNAPNGINASALYPGQPNVTFTATVMGTSNTTVTWSLTGTACTGTGNPCGTIDPTTGVYQAPTSPVSATVTATLTSDSSVTGTLPIAVISVSVIVTPLTVTVGQNLVQQFTAVAVPDDAPQTFSWSCTPIGSCGSFVCTPSSACEGQAPGVAAYTAPVSNESVTVAATSTVAGSSVGTSKVAVVTSRLPSGTYAFRFSGYDNSGDPVATAGSFTLAANGTITAGIEDVLSVVPPQTQQYPIASVVYAASSNNDNSNNLGTLTLKLTNGGATITNIYTAVLTSSGIIRMIESDGFGSGSGVMQKSAPQSFGQGAQTFAFGFTGADSSTPSKRVGYVGILPMFPSNAPQCTNNVACIVGGLLDTNDNGGSTGVCGTPPCTVTGSFSQPNVNLPTLWNMTLTLGAITQHFDFFISAGQAQTKTAAGPLTLYAISTDPAAADQPALSGDMIYQVPLTYNNAAFNGGSVSNLRGVQVVNSSAVADTSNVALIVGGTDGTSSGTGGTGGFTGSFDQNDQGNILSAVAFPSSSQSPSPYTYVATNGNTGRYIFYMLGNPSASTVLAPLPFVLYASGGNRGFLLDESSPAVMTGTMDPQLTPNNFSYTATEMPGTYAAATIGNSDSAVTPVVENLVLTSTGSATYNVAGVQNPGSQPLAGSYTLVGIGAGAGTGTITLTTPASQTYVIYAIDASTAPGTSNDVITDFFMMGSCAPQPPATTCSSGPPSSIIFAQQ
jgi:hypothetical protein